MSHEISDPHISCGNSETPQIFHTKYPTPRKCPPPAYVTDSSPMPARIHTMGSMALLVYACMRGEKGISFSVLTPYFNVLLEWPLFLTFYWNGPFYRFNVFGLTINIFALKMKDFCAQNWQFFLKINVFVLKIYSSSLLPFIPPKDSVQSVLIKCLEMLKKRSYLISKCMGNPRESPNFNVLVLLEWPPIL